jgi:hypothetical protein
MLTGYQKVHIRAGKFQLPAKLIPDVGLMIMDYMPIDASNLYDCLRWIDCYVQKESELLRVWSRYSGKKMFTRWMYQFFGCRLGNVPLDQDDLAKAIQIIETNTGNADFIENYLKLPSGFLLTGGRLAEKFVYEMVLRIVASSENRPEDRARQLIMDIRYGGEYINLGSAYSSPAVLPAYGNLRALEITRHTMVCVKDELWQLYSIFNSPIICGSYVTYLILGGTANRRQPCSGGWIPDTIDVYVTQASICFGSRNKILELGLAIGATVAKVTKNSIMLEGRRHNIQIIPVETILPSLPKNGAPPHANRSVSENQIDIDICSFTIVPGWAGLSVIGTIGGLVSLMNGTMHSCTEKSVIADRVAKYEQRGFVSNISNVREISNPEFTTIPIAQLHQPLANTGPFDLRRW